MNAYQTALDLGLTGTDAEKVAVLQLLTASAIKIPDLRKLFRETGLLIKGRSGWTGALAAVESSAIDILTDALDDPNQQTIETNKQVWGPLFAQTLAGLVAATLITQIQSNAVLSLGGGQPFADLTVEQFAAQGDAETATEDRESAYAGIVAKANAATSQAALALEQALTPEQITAAGVAGWEGS